MHKATAAQIGDRVSFRIADVFLPEPAEVLTKLTPEVEANGVVMEFSDSGSSPRACLVDDSNGGTARTGYTPVTPGTRTARAPVGSDHAALSARRRSSTGSSSEGSGRRV